MIIVKLRQAIEDYRLRTGEKMNYEKLAMRTGLARSTLESIASRQSYNASLNTIDKICTALGCSLEEILEFKNQQTEGKREQNNEN